MAYSSESDGTATAFSGEVWTGARGHATVALPRTAGRLQGELPYKVRPFTTGVKAQIAAELFDRRFTIGTDEPHVKVAWGVSGRRPHQAKTDSEEVHGPIHPAAMGPSRRHRCGNRIRKGLMALHERRARCFGKRRHSYSPLIYASFVIAVAVTAASARASFPGEPGRIAFMSNRDGDFDIYTIKQNGKGTCS